MSCRRPATAIRQFLQTDAAGGYVPMAATALAMIVANSPWSAAYAASLHARVGHRERRT